MRRWVKHASLNLPPGGEGEEDWILLDGDRVQARYPVALRLGKELDVLKLRTESSSELREYAAKFRDIVKRLYADENRLRRIAACPCCRASADHFRPALAVYGATYVRCGGCGHVFVAMQPAPEDLYATFADEESLSVFYVDSKSLEMRMRDIIQPKIDWTLDAYLRFVGGTPSSVLDVGAGGGHFVAGCRRNGLRAEGLELSTASVGFAKRAFDIELLHGNFLERTFERGQFDLLTFWGLLEYAPEPATFLEAARAQLDPHSGMLVIEVPRCDSLSLAVQEQFTDTIWRHAMPDSHMNLYSDESLATLLHENGFKPVAAWYFGMDVYELLMQIDLSLGSDNVLHSQGRLVAPLQHVIDRTRLSDDIVVAAVPVA